LDHETRALLLALRVEVELEIAGGTLQGKVASAGAAPPLHGLLLSRTLPLVLRAARRLRRPPEVAARLAHNARHDRMFRVRRQNLLCLARDHPDLEVTREPLRAACADPSPDVRVRAAMALGEDGRTTLLEVARQPDGEDLPTARAVAALGDHFPLEATRELLARSLRARRVETARECLLSLGGRGAAEAVSAIAKVLAVDRGDLAVAAAEALAESGLAAAEPPLIAALGSDSVE